MNIGTVGTEGEKRVAEFLRRQGYVIVKRNFVCRYGEVDIIAENDKLLVFVEVKTRKSDSMFSGREAVDGFKQKRMVLTANDYIRKTENSKQPRFDIAEVTIYPKNDGNLGYKLHYIENAF
jgi:putative endonuclease